MKPPHWFAVERVKDNRIKGLMREIAEIIDDEHMPAALRDIRVSLLVLADGASEKAFRISKGSIR